MYELIHTQNKLYKLKNREFPIFLWSEILIFKHGQRVKIALEYVKIIFRHV